MFYKNNFNYKPNNLNILLFYKIFALKLFSSIKLSTSMGAIATTLLFSHSVMAQSLKEYCIVRENKEELVAKKPLGLLYDTSDLKVTVNKDDRQYIISLDQNNRRKLLLTRVGEREPIAQMTLAQEGGHITNFTVGEDNWLWIDRNAIDYVMKINLLPNNPYFESPTRLPELSAQPCYLFQRLFKKCRPGQYNYSSSLNRVFVGGYPIKSWRKRNYLHLEFVSGEKKPVPESLMEAKFVGDIPEWNGALFRLSSGEALFYDGKTVTNLSEDFLKLNNGDKFKDWNIRKTAGGRSFLGKFKGRKNGDPLFLMELNSQPGFTPVYLPEDFNERWLEPVTLASDRDRILWIVTRKTIFAEVKRQLQAVVNLPQSFFIERLKNRVLASNKDDTLLFPVKEKETKLTTNYLLKETAATDNCDTIINLDLDRSTILEVRGKTNTENTLP